MMDQSKWDANKIPDLSGKIIIVTGGNSGIGYESVKAFSGKGARVIMASRLLEKAEAAKGKLLTKNPQADINIMELDLADLNSIRAFAERFKKMHSRLDVLLNNAGIMNVPYSLTKDGFETQLGTNHLGHFALSGLLLETLLSTPKSRVVSVSSIAHKKAVIDFDNLMFDQGRDYNGMVAYRRSKLCNLYFTFELQSFFESRQAECMALVAHPGVTESNIARHLLGPILFPILKPLIKIVLQKASRGALPQIRASVDPGVRGGEFYGPDGSSEWRGFPVLVEPTDYAKNRDNARKLWEMSEELTGIKY